MTVSSKNVLPSAVQTPISLDEFREIALTPPGRTILLLRHAERPKIQEDDPTFGEDLGLTEAGIRMAKTCGETLSGIKNCRFGASPMRRTRKTARLLAAGMGIKNVEIFEAPEAGTRGLWVESIERLHAGHQKEGSAYFTERYLRNGYAEGYMPIHKGTARMSKWLTQTDFGADCTVILSHDIFIAAFLQGLGVRDFGSENWVGYLQGAALTQNHDGNWQAFYCVPDKTNFANSFIQ